MVAGPYPTRTMFEALRTRVEATEAGLEAVPSSGASAPAWLSTQVLLDTAGTRPIAPEKIPDGLQVRSCTLTLAGDAEPLTFSELRGGLAQSFAGLVVYAASSAQTFSQANYDLLNAGTEEGPDGNVLTLPEPLTIPPGGVLHVEFYDWINHGDVSFRADPVLPPGITYTVQTTPASAPVAALPFTLLIPGTVLGTLAPGAMNVVGAPSPLAPGDFEIVDSGSAATLRFRAGNGTVYALTMTPE